jgi:hypothetical protein
MFPSPNVLTSQTVRDAFKEEGELISLIFANPVETLLKDSSDHFINSVYHHQASLTQ